MRGGWVGWAGDKEEWGMRGVEWSGVEWSGEERMTGCWERGKKTGQGSGNTQPSGSLRALACCLEAICSLVLYVMELAAASVHSFLINMMTLNPYGVHECTRLAYS